MPSVSIRAGKTCITLPDYNEPAITKRNGLAPGYSFYNTPLPAILRRNRGVSPPGYNKSAAAHIQISIGYIEKTA